jgi:hypothetical protein
VHYEQETARGKPVALLARDGAPLRCELMRTWV